MVPDPVVRTLPGYKVSPCLVDGTFPINTAVIKNSKTLVNSATNIVTITLNEEGNYTCLARSNYGTDVKNFTVLFNGETFITEDCNLISRSSKVSIEISRLKTIIQRAMLLGSSANVLAGTMLLDRSRSSRDDLETAEQNAKLANEVASFY